jgi:hypothetical protein
MTARLNVLADSASAAGTTVLRAAGAQFEGEISFTGLNQLLFPLLDDLGEFGATTGTCCGWRRASVLGHRRTGCWRMPVSR